jgi:hypothetical protein
MFRSLFALAAAASLAAPAFAEKPSKTSDAPGTPILGQMQPAKSPRGKQPRPPPYQPPPPPHQPKPPPPRNAKPSQPSKTSNVLKTRHDGAKNTIGNTR